jgi:hypothetical protein
MNFRALALLVIPPLAACGGSSEGTPPVTVDVALTNANNYTSESELHISTVQTASGADLDICWDGITKDILCHDIVPGSNGIDNVAFLKIPNMSKDQVQKKLTTGQLQVAQVSTYGDFHTANGSSKCVKLSQLALGKAIAPATDYVEASNQTYMILFAKGTTPGVGARSMIFIEPKASETNTMVTAPDGCSTDILDFQATLGQPIGISAADSTKWVVGWKDVTKDSFGNTVPTGHLNRVMVGFFQGKTASDIQDHFLDIEQDATALYEVSVGQGNDYVNLADAKLRGANTAFPGFTQTDGAWMVAVMCDQCQLPAPIVLSVLTLQ